MAAKIKFLFDIESAAAKFAKATRLSVDDASRWLEAESARRPGVGRERMRQRRWSRELSRLRKLRWR